jgi:hypothetical protein
MREGFQMKFPSAPYSGPMLRELELVDWFQQKSLITKFILQNRLASGAELMLTVSDRLTL